jgi:hypothetical protein
VPKTLRMTDEDWLPLSEADLCHRPGEAADVKKREIVPPAPPAPPAGPDPAAEKALAELKSKLAQAAPATSLIAEAQHREQRVERKQKAAAAPQLAATVVQGQDPFAVPVVEYAVGLDGRDEREESEWFRALPAKEQERLHREWAAKRLHEVGARAGHRANANRRFVAALVVFAATIVLGTGVYWHATLGAGIVCGLWWRHARPCRFLDPLRAAGCLFAMQSVAMLAHGRASATMFMDSVLLVAFAAVVGVDGEIRRSGGFDVK